MTALRALRPHQERAIAGLRQSLLTGHTRPMLKMPTGSGKTLTAAHIVAGALGKNKRVAFVVPRTTLVDQTIREFEREGISAIGVMQAAHLRTDSRQPIQICSAQTLARRERPDVDLVIVDEAHEMHASVLRWAADCPGIPFIGLSATPWARGLGKYYDDLIIPTTTRELIDQGFLSDFVAYAPSDPDLSQVSAKRGDYDEDELAGVMRSRSRPTSSRRGSRAARTNRRLLSASIVDTRSTFGSVSERLELRPSTSTERRRKAMTATTQIRPEKPGATSSTGSSRAPRRSLSA